MSICHFELVADMVGGDIREFMCDMDGPVFLKMELMGFAVDRSEFTITHVEQRLFMCFKSIQAIFPM